MRFSLKSIIPFIIQGIILICCLVLINKISTIPPAFLLLLRYFAYIILVLGMFLSIWFNGGKVFFISLFLIFCHLLISYYTIFKISENTFSRVVYPILWIIIPLNIILFSQLKERGIFSIWGKLKILFILVEMGCIYYIVNSNIQLEIINESFNASIFGLGKAINSPTVLIVYILCLVFLIIKILLTKSSNDKRMIGVIIFTFLALLNIKNMLIVAIFLGAAGLILIMGIIEDSYMMAYMDELTGIPSRRAMRETLMKLGNKYVIAMVDIDFFKKFNDTYGHDVGDEVLKLVAWNLETVTGGGKAFRYGGEEFTIVFPGKTIEDVIPYLDKLRDQVSKAGYTKKSDTAGKTKKTTSKQIFVTISIGVAEKNPKNKNTNDVMKAADKALYRAKKKGRNCVSK